MRAYLNDTLHKHGLVINKLTRSLALDEVLQGTNITEAKALDVTEEAACCVILKRSRVASLARQWCLRSVNDLRELLKGRFDGVSCCAGGLLVLLDHRRGCG